MINADVVLHTSGIVLIILISASLVSFTSKFIFGAEKIAGKKPTNQIYDPDHGRNVTPICIASKEPFATAYDSSSCFNKTQIHWYNPWLGHALWRRFWAERKTEEPEVVEPENVTVNETAPPEAPLPPEKEPEKPKERPIEFVYSILVGLLMVSALVACWEVFKDKLTRNEAAAAKVQERECTLAEFTINRHLRRESKQQQQHQGGSHLPRQGSLEVTAKVTQNLIHQSSLDRAFPKIASEAMNPLETRRSSMPFYLGNESESNLKRSAAFKLGKRLSVDVPGEELNLDLKKKPRYFIRRH